MVVRKERKVKKLRGKRRHGKGNIKNRRGAGNRGGRGNAGLHKHKWTYTVKYEPDRYGNKGFVRHVRKKELPTINIWEIENKINRGELEKKGELYLLTFEGKVLGTGKLTHPVLVRATKFTEKAIKKIEDAGGKVEELSPKVVE